MAWFEQLDNDGKKTGYRRFFSDAEKRGLDEIQKKTKRVRWVVSNEHVIEENKKVIEPPKFEKTVTLIDVNETNDKSLLVELGNKANTAKVKLAIEKKIEMLNKQNKED